MSDGFDRRREQLELEDIRQSELKAMTPFERVALAIAEGAAWALAVRS